MVARQRKRRATAASTEVASVGGKRSAGDKDKEEAIETNDPPRKRAAVAEDDVEPGPEPTAQHVAHLELKVHELRAENERLKEQVEKLQMQHRGDQPNESAQPKTNSKPKRKLAAKAQPKDKPVLARVQPKRKAGKAQPKSKSATA